MIIVCRLSVAGNPIRTIRRNLLSESTVKLKAYLRTRAPLPSYVSGSSYHCDDPEVEASTQLEVVVNERFRNLWFVKNHSILILIKFNRGNHLDLSNLQLDKMPSNWLDMVR